MKTIKELEAVEDWEIPALYRQGRIKSLKDVLELIPNLKKAIGDIPVVCDGTFFESICEVIDKELKARISG